jgi:ADP-ribose pyrophosphatase
VERHGLTGIVAIIPITDEDNIVLLKQYREPFEKEVIEIPAGLVGDEGKETALEAAKRELFEETGYEAGSLEEIGTFCVSPGLCTEALTYVLATDLKKTGKGEGDGTEQIQAFELPVISAAKYLLEMAREGWVMVDAKVFASLLFAYNITAQRMQAKVALARESGLQT